MGIIQIHALAASYQGKNSVTHLIVGWVSLKFLLHAVAKRKISASPLRLRDCKSDSAVVHFVATELPVTDQKQFFETFFEPIYNM
jgi:hypothetical protein